MSWWAAVYARERPSHPCIWSQLKSIYFIVSPRSEGDSGIRECLVICVDCVFKRLCKFWVGHQDPSLPPVNLLPPNELLGGTSFRWRNFLKVCSPSERPLEWDGYFLGLPLQCCWEKALTERVKGCYCSSYQQTSHLPLVLTGILWLLIILSNSSLIFLYFSSVRGVSA